MSSIWLIEQGSYSDYRILGVFSSLENAEAARDWLPNSDWESPEVREWILDPSIEEIKQGFDRYIVHMRMNGDIEKLFLIKHAIDDNEFYLWDRPSAPAYEGKDVEAVFVSSVIAPGSEHAVKVTNERRIMWLAKQ